MATDDKYTVSLLHFDGGLTDESGKVWTAQNGAAVSTSQYKFGGSSMALNSGCLSTQATSDFVFGSEDFTVDFWLYMPSFAATHILCEQFTGQNGPGWTFYVASGELHFYADDRLIVRGNHGMSVNYWHHIALVRHNNIFNMYINGKSVGSSTYSLVLGTGIGAFIGARGGTNLRTPAGTYMDEFRISKGIARWISEFTPPTTPYTQGIFVSPPTNLTATAGDSQVTLSWTAVTGATGYNVKRSTTAGGPYTTIATKVTDTKYVDNTVTNGTTCYYVVTAVTADGESSNSNEASATPQAPPIESGIALLQVTMNNSNEREYKLSIAEIEGFIHWFNNYTSADTKSYMLNKTVGKEYLAFDKIISFEVIPLNK
jgi:hypothetical protein